MQHAERRGRTSRWWAMTGLVGLLLGAPASRAEDVLPLGQPAPLIRRGAEEATAPPRRPASTFDRDVEGWTSSDGENALSVEDGHLRVHDINETWCWIQAPDDFVGNWTSFGQISFTIRGDAASTPRYPMVLELSAPAASATYEVHRRFVVPGAWRTVTVPLRPAMWSVTGDWKTLLTNVRSFRLRLDLHGATDALEVHELDEVRLVSKARAISTFVAGLEGWTVEGGTLENGGRHLRVVDQGSGWCWMRAPMSFRGNWSNVSRLEFDVEADRRGPVVQPLRIQIESLHGMAIVELPLDAVTSGLWRTARVPLDPVDWAVSGPWSKILGNVSDLWIRLDLTAAYESAETTRFTNVRLLTGSIDRTVSCALRVKSASTLRRASRSQSRAATARRWTVDLGCTPVRHAS